MDTKSIKFIFFSGDNGIDFPKGGITSFTRHMMRVFGNSMAIVGISTDNTKVGKWLKKDIDGQTYMFFSIARVNKKAIKPLIPQRLSGYLNLKKYKNEILKLKVRNAFVQNSHFLLAINGWDIPNKAYIFHGANNPLEKPRYAFGKFIAPYYEKLMVKRLRSYQTIFAAADDNDIDKLIARSGHKLEKDKIKKLPTRFDDTIFFPRDQKTSRKALKLDTDQKILVQVGRISKQKGCDLILHAFKNFNDAYPGSWLIFVGDGEERHSLQSQIDRLGLKNRVSITGFVSTEEVALYYNAADLALVGSYMEGWSIAMVEALACGKNIVSTNVSGAKDMIDDGKNGYVVESRDPEFFSKKMIDAVKLPVTNERSLKKSETYSLSTLKTDIEKYWITVNNE